MLELELDGVRAQGLGLGIIRSGGNMLCKSKRAK